MRSRASLIAIAIAVSSPSAIAQNAEAEQLFQEADRLMAAGKYSEACTAFEGSNRIEARAGTLIRLGDCREKNKQLASAWSAYRDALSRVKDPRKRDAAQKAVQALEPRLSKLTIKVPAAARIAGLAITRNGKVVDEALWDRAVAVDGGDSSIVASAPGRKAATLSASVPVEKGQVAIEIPVLEDATTLPVVTKDPADKPLDKPVDKPLDKPVGETPSDSPGMFTTRRKVALGVAVVGAGGFALGSVFGLQAKKLEDEAFELCPSFDEECANAAQAQSKLDSGSSRALLSNVMFGVGVLGVAGAVVLWVTGAPETSSGVAIRPTLTTTEIGFAIGGPL
jgi:tetratricopeptide (TPR) repeat protein